MRPLPKDIICKYCGQNVGKYWSELEEHLWVKHREVMMTFLSKQAKPNTSKQKTKDRSSR